MLRAWVSKKSTKKQNKVNNVYAGPQYGIYEQFNCSRVPISVLKRAFVFVEQGFYLIGFYGIDDGFSIIHSKIAVYFLNIFMMT